MVILLINIFQDGRVSTPFSDTLMFADNASLLISNINCNEFMNTFIKVVLSYSAKWVHTNWPIVNVNETNIVKFTQSKLSFNPLTIVYDGKLLSKVLNFKFPGLLVDKHLN
jgi:hypothetical protein